MTSPIKSNATPLQLNPKEFSTEKTRQKENRISLHQIVTKTTETTQIIMQTDGPPLNPPKIQELQKNFNRLEFRLSTLERKLKASERQLTLMTNNYSLLYNQFLAALHNQPVESKESPGISNPSYQVIDIDEDKNDSPQQLSKETQTDARNDRSVRQSFFHRIRPKLTKRKQDTNLRSAHSSFDLRIPNVNPRSRTSIAVPNKV